MARWALRFGLFLLAITSLAQASAEVKFKRIVSASLASDEILLAIIPKKSARLIAVSKLATDPNYSAMTAEAESRSVKTFGTELESLLSLKPDLVVLASYNRPDFVRKLEAAKVKTFVLKKFSSLADIKANIKTLGQLTDRTAAANKLIDRSFSPLEKLVAPKKKMSVLVFSPDLYVAGTGTSFDSICEHAHVTNEASVRGIKGFAKVGAEALVKMNPDFIIVPVGNGQTKEEAKQQLLKHSSYNKLAAAKDDRVIYVPSANLTSVSHTVAAAVKTIHQGAYDSF